MSFRYNLRGGDFGKKEYKAAESDESGSLVKRSVRYNKKS